jgi:hypothetical protein
LAVLRTLVQLACQIPQLFVWICHNKVCSVSKKTGGQINLPACSLLTQVVIV